MFITHYNIMYVLGLGLLSFCNCNVGSIGSHEDQCYYTCCVIYVCSRVCYSVSGQPSDVKRPAYNLLQWLHFS